MMQHLSSKFFILPILLVFLSCDKPQENLQWINNYKPENNGGDDDGGDKPDDPCNQTDPGHTVPSDGTFVIIGYDYGSNSDSFLPDPTYLTHINFAFGKVGSDHQSLEIKKETRLKKIVGLKKQKPSLKVVLSVGGWGADYFSGMAADETKRKTFCNNCLAAVNKYGLDGIDLDWEYPGRETSEHIEASSADKDNFTLLVKDLREVLGEGKLITMASSADEVHVDFPEVLKYMDWVNIMTYDMGHPGSSNNKHNAALYSSSMAPKTSCDKAVRMHYNAGVPYDRMTLGMPFYGRDDNSTFTGGDDDNFVYYKNISTEGYNVRWDEDAKVPYLTTSSGTMVLSYDNEESISLKANYVKEKGLRGAMYWAIQGDDADWTLSKAIAGPLIGWAPAQEEAFLVTNSYVEKFLTEVDYGSTLYYGDEGHSRVRGYPGGGPSVNNEEIPPAYTITWKAANSSQKLVVSEGDWSREYSLQSGVSSQDITNLVPNTTYKWKVTTTGDVVVASGSFPTRGHLRQVYYEPNVRNGRDLGGYKGLDGKTVVYHKLIRGGGIHGSRTSSSGKNEMLAEGIRAEVDLREAKYVPSSSPLGSSVDFYAPEFDSGYNEMIKYNPDKTKATFMWVVQKLREDKPVYFHCAAGRDRTATLAVLLEGVLGVSESDMAKDYELTYFTPSDWGMSTDDNGNPIYKHTYDNYSYGSIHTTIFEQTDSGTYQERIVKYLLKIGVPQQDIDDLREIMLK